MLSAKPASTKVNLRLRQDQDDRRDWQWWTVFRRRGWQWWPVFRRKCGGVVDKNILYSLA